MLYGGATFHSEVLASAVALWERKSEWTWSSLTTVANNHVEGTRVALSQPLVTEGTP